MASAILFTVVCWGSRLRVADANRLNKLDRKASDVVWVEVEQRSTFSQRLIAPKCTTERHRKSFLPVAINLYNSSLWRSDSFGYLKDKTNNITIHSHFIYNATTISLYIVNIVVYFSILLFICILLPTLIFYFVLMSTVIFYFIYIFIFSACFHSCYISISTLHGALEQKQFPLQGLIKYSESESEYTYQVGNFWRYFLINDLTIIYIYQHLLMYNQSTDQLTITTSTT